MKMLINEKQFAKILQKEQEIEEAESLTSPSTSNQTTGSSILSSPSSSTSTGGDEGGKGQMDFPPYPEVGHWESGVSRGPGNQIGVTKWEEIVGSTLSRGKANQLK